VRREKDVRLVEGGVRGRVFRVVPFGREWGERFWKKSGISEKNTRRRGGGQNLRKEIDQDTEGETTLNTPETKVLSRPVLSVRGKRGNDERCMKRARKQRKREKT